MKTPFIQSVCLPEMSRTPDVITPLIEKILYRARAGRVVSIQVLENTPTKRHHTVNSEFFTSIGFTPMGGMVRLYNTRKGKSVRLLCEVFNIPPASLKTGKSHKGVRQMNTTTSASAQSATSSTSSNPILTASEQASENAAMEKMFAEVRKAEAQDRIRAAAQATTDAEAAHSAESTPNSNRHVRHASTTPHAVAYLVRSTKEAQDILDKLGSLFFAIAKLSESNPTAIKLASIGNELASIGNELAVDWAYIFDSNREDWEGCLASLDNSNQACIEENAPDALALRYPISGEPFAVWFNKTAVEENSPDPWAVNNATGQAVFDLSSLDAAQLFAEKLKHRNAVVSVMKGGAK